MSRIRTLGLGEARVTGGFWSRKIDMVASEMLPYQWKALNDEIAGAEPSHAIENFRIAAGESAGEFKGNIWQDSDVAKWLEAASYSLAHHPDAALEAEVDEAVRLIAKAQRPDGYVNSYFIAVAPDKRWADLSWGHELYCAGHLIEAAVAHNACTGKTSLLDVARRYADCIDREFGPRPGQRRAVCGHPEIELALFRLYRATGEARYRELGSFFVDERGRDPGALEGKIPLGFEIPSTRWFLADYFVGHKPVRLQRDAEGHAVRAVYLYSAMAEEYMASGEPALLDSLHALWESMTGRRMYLTGSIGSQSHGERFTVDYDLPADRVYAETCASIGLAFWASRMTEIEGDGRYADVLERALYNGILSGVSLDGTRYFYVNPLEVEPRVAAARYDLEHVKTSRVQWFGCACCPPNIARLVASLASYLYGASDDTLWIHHYAESEAFTVVAGAKVRLTQRTDYPWSGGIALFVDPESSGELDFSLKLRIPGWCRSFSCSVNGCSVATDSVSKGYLELRRKWKVGDRVDLELEMESRVLCADERISSLAGKLAVQRGPLVYCAEALDNGEALQALAIDAEAPLKAEFKPDLMGGSVQVMAQGVREECSMPKAGAMAAAFPYGDSSARRLVPGVITLVPYHQWGNRAPDGEMRVWLRRK
jgi:Uncharacterized protein conserved in bacteria